MKLFTQKTFDECRGKDNLDFQCDGCNIIFQRTKSSHLDRIRKGKSVQHHFCSYNCYRKNISSQNITLNCLNCKVIFIKNSSKIKKSKSGNHFCSKSCAASYNNRKFPKRKRKIKYCKYCKDIIKRGKTVCNNCNPNLIDWSTITLRDLRNKRSNQKNSIVRSLSRKKYLESYKHRHCLRCGYNKYIEIAHIKAISEFSLDTPISDINDLNNLISLCRNCHWELDHKLLTIEEIKNTIITN